MRLYLPSTLPALAVALDAGTVDVEIGFAVTPALREWHIEGDSEQLEYVAMSAAARQSLPLLPAGVAPARAPPAARARRGCGAGPPGGRGRRGGRRRGSPGTRGGPRGGPADRPGP